MTPEPSPPAAAADDDELLMLMRDRLRPLRVAVDAAGRVVAIDGDAAHYGYADLRPGVVAEQAVELLTGLIDVAEIDLEAVQTPSGRSADIRWRRGEAGGSLILFDATDSGRLLQTTQQVGNESQILQYRLKQTAEQLRRKQQELIYVAYHDALTGLYNRRQFFERLPEEIARSRRNGKPLSLLLIDIDHFKGYNDRYGHLAGDRCLAEVAKAIGRFAQRPADVAARVGGEEFALLLPETDGDGAAELGGQLCREVQGLAIEHLGAGLGTVSISIGAAEQPGGTDDPAWETLFKLADAALYDAKHRGRNQVVRAPQ